MRFPSVSDINISKPRKDGSTYFAQFTVAKKNPVIIQLDAVSCITNKNTLYVKNKELMNYMVDLNEYIIDTVKQKCSSWFNSNMNTDLIDEYYVNPLRYDKVNGYLVKLGDSLDKEDGKYNLVLEVKGLRFLKQKFNLEWSVTEVTHAQDIEFAMDDEVSEPDEEEEDIPEPIPDDVNDMKDKYITLVSDLHSKYKKQADDIQSIVEKLENARNDILAYTTLAEFFVIDDLVESLQ